MTNICKNEDGLYPCPFCGMPDLEGSPWPANREKTLWIIRCGNPNCAAEVSDIYLEFVIQKWNRRI